jgi:hypothetical protein
MNDDLTIRCIYPYVMQCRDDILLHRVFSILIEVQCT